VVCIFIASIIRQLVAFRDLVADGDGDRGDESGDRRADLQTWSAMSAFARDLAWWRDAFLSVM
jgi:hypothetical protein